MTQYVCCRKILLIFLLVAAGVITVACSPIRIDANPDLYPFNPEEIQEYQAKPSIFIDNAYKQSEIVKLSTFGRDLEGDLMQYTQTTVDILGRELKNQSIKIEDSADKTVVLRVHDPDYQFGAFVVRMTLKL